MSSRDLAILMVTSAACFLGSCRQPADPQRAAPIAADTEAAAPAGGIGETPISIGTTLHLESSVLGDTRELNVWLPPSYAEGEQSYPVLYLIDGGLDQDFHHISGLAQLATINKTYEELIVVGIQTKNRIMELTHEPFDPRNIRDPPTAGKSADFIELIRAEVIPLIESRYRTGARRAVIGESLAGLLVVEVFARHPDTFTDYVAISPSLWWDDKALAESAGEWIASHDGTPRRLYLTMADEGGTMQAGLDLVIEAIEANQPTGLTWHYVDRRQTESHASIYHGAALDALKKLFGVPPPERGEPPWYLVEGAQPPEAAAERDG